MSTEVSHLQNILSTSNPGSNSNFRSDSAHTSIASTSTIEQRQNLASLGQEMAAELQKKEESAEAVVVSGLAEAADFMNNQVQTYARNLEFSVEEETGKMIVRVYDSETEELVRQIPSEDMVELVRRLQQQDEASSQLIEGLLLKITV